MESFETLTPAQGAPIKMWTRGVLVEAEARQQLLATASMPFIFRHLAVMPDVHLGKGSTIGSVIPTRGAIIPAAVGVDIGCGMMAVRSSLAADPSSLAFSRKVTLGALDLSYDFGPVTLKAQSISPSMF